MANINKIKLSGTTYNIQDSNAALVSDVFITAQNRNSIQSVIKEGVYSLSTDDVYSITGTKANSTDRIKGLIIVDNTSYNFTGSTSSDVEGVSALVGIVTFDLSSNFSISLVDRDTNHINELFIESFTSDGEESPMTNITITHNPSVGVNKIDYVATLYTEFVHEKYALSEELSGKQDTLIAGSGITISGNVISATGGGSGGSGATVIEVTQAQYDALVSAGTLDLTALYIITDAQAGDLSQYYTSAQTESAITQAVSGKVDTSAITTAVTSGSTDSEIPTAKAVFDAIPTGGTGGGKAISAGTNISVTTGETADTINCTVPASASSGNYSIMFGQPASSGDASGSKTITGGQWSKAYSEGSVAIGQMNEARGSWAWAIGNLVKTNGKASFACGDFTSANAQYAFSEGTNTTANTEASHSAGRYTNTKNRSEFSIGEYNNSVSASTTFGDSGNTLFSVGNGTADNARHNAFEIRQNGDIYLSYNGNDVKLQDLIADIYSKLPTS